MESLKVEWKFPGEIRETKYQVSYFERGEWRFHPFSFDNIEEVEKWIENKRTRRINKFRVRKTVMSYKVYSYFDDDGIEFISDSE